MLRHALSVVLYSVWFDRMRQHVCPLVLGLKKKMLEDTNTDKILKMEPTEEKKRKLKAQLKPLLNKNKID